MKSLPYIWLSILLHLVFVVLVCLYANDGNRKSKTENKRMEFEVYEQPKMVAPNLDLKIKKPMARPLKNQSSQNQVFGISKQALNRDAKLTDAVKVKAGNTLAKEQDDKPLLDEDDSPLPTPTDEYLISVLPRLEKQIRIVYPPLAKAKGIEGNVVMELLIDSTGKVRKVNTISGPGSGLNEAAEEAVLRFQFIPGKVDDRAVAVKIRYTYKFVLENR